MAKITNETAQEAVNQAANQTSQAQQTAEATGLLDQTLGPALQFWESLPIYGKVAVVGAVGAGFLAYHWIENREPDSKLEATEWREKLDNLFKTPVEKTGRVDDTLLYNKTDVAGKRCIGVIKKLDKNNTNIGSDQLKSALNDEDKFKELKENGRLSVDGVTYAVVPGRKKLDRLINTVLYKLAGIISSGSNPQAEYFDIPVSQVKVTDEGVVIKEGVKLEKEDGLWQTATMESQLRIQELTWMTTHKNYTDTMQKLTEFYSDLNMNISGIKNIENTKSKNMREYKKEEKLREKGEAMEE